MNHHLSLTQQAQLFLRQHIIPGDFVVDATAGNGHDSLLLAELVGEQGRVISFDNQPVAIEAARTRLYQAGLDSVVSFLCVGHERMTDNVPAELHGKLKAVVFNLGYLPGGDKAHTTQQASTLDALQQAFGLLMPGGILSIIAYTGHPGGRDEAEAVRQWATTLSKADTEVVIPASEKNNAPEWIRINKQ